jgi:hypothetical protein
MCGIAGFFSRNGAAKPADVGAMNRAPDEAISTDGPCGIGMGRLSTIDLTGRRNNHHQLYAVPMLELWFESLDAPVAVPDSSNSCLALGD